MIQRHGAAGRRTQCNSREGVAHADFREVHADALPDVSGLSLWHESGPSQAIHQIVVGKIDCIVGYIRGQVRQHFLYATSLVGLSRRRIDLNNPAVCEQVAKAIRTRVEAGRIS